MHLCLRKNVRVDYSSIRRFPKGRDKEIINLEETTKHEAETSEELQEFW